MGTQNLVPTLTVVCNVDYLILLYKKKDQMYSNI